MENLFLIYIFIICFDTSILSRLYNRQGKLSEDNKKRSGEVEKIKR